ncbi:MAG: sulfite exporter TauE/SafE family protein [Candidatus Ozemobacteraceae bacterium]
MKNSKFLYSWGVLLFWFVFMTWHGLWAYIAQHWPVSITMIFGSFVAGATTEGGGAVAFPVFTKLLHVPSNVARDFALAIQSIGMTCGSLLIIRKGYKFLPEVFGWSFLGASVSVIFCLEYIAPQIPSPYPKILFTLFTTCFGFFLLFLSSGNRTVHTEIPLNSWRRRLAFITVGIVGGFISALVGSGADVVLFVVLCLRYNLDEKIGTRTTVFLMGSVSMVAFLWKMITGTIAPEVLPMWLSAVPIVAFGAPLGAIFCSWQKREHVVAFLLGLIFVELVTTIWLVPFDTQATLISLAFITVSIGIMHLLQKIRENE